MTAGRAVQTMAIAAFAGLSLALSGCGGDAEDTESAPGASVTDSAEGSDDTQGQPSGGKATLAVDGKAYEFDSVQCAFDEETGNEDFDFSLSAIGDGMQLSVDTGPTYGDSIELDDIEDFDDPKVGWSSDRDGFLTIDGLEVAGTTQFLDTTDETLQTKAEGYLVATCP